MDGCGRDGKIDEGETDGRRDEGMTEGRIEEWWHGGILDRSALHIRKGCLCDAKGAGTRMIGVLWSDHR